MRPSQLLRKLAALPAPERAGGSAAGKSAADLNLLAAIIIYWNTLKLGNAVFA